LPAVFPALFRCYQYRQRRLVPALPVNKPGRQIPAGILPKPADQAKKLLPLSGDTAAALRPAPAPPAPRTDAPPKSDPVPHSGLRWGVIFRAAPFRDLSECYAAPIPCRSGPVIAAIWFAGHRLFSGSSCRLFHRLTE